MDGQPLNQEQPTDRQTAAPSEEDSATTPPETLDANTVELLITLTKDPTNNNGTVSIKKITDKTGSKTYFNTEPLTNTINTAWPQPSAATHGGSKHRSRRNRRNKSRQRSSTNSRPNLSFNQIQRRTRRQLFRQLF